MPAPTFAARAAEASASTAQKVDVAVVGAGFAGSQSSSLSVDLVQRQRPAAPTTMGEGKDGARAGGASGRDGDLGGRFLIAGLLRTAAGEPR